MKKILFGAVLLGAIFTGCKKDDTNDSNNTGTNGNSTGPTAIVIPQTQRATVIYFGGTWCPPCGSNGKPAKERIKKDVGDKSVIISCQVGNDPMANSFSSSMQSFFAVSGVPSMFIGGNDATIASIPSTSAMGTNSVNKVNEIAALSAKVNAVLDVTEANGFISAKLKGQFFDNLSGEYYIAAFLLEHNLTHNQVSDASQEKNVHHNILRERNGANNYGELLKNNPTKDERFEKEYTFVMKSPWVKNNLEVVIVFWKKNADGKFVLSNSVSAKIK
jgi:hypothetical protein